MERIMARREVGSVDVDVEGEWRGGRVRDVDGRWSWGWGAEEEEGRGGGGMVREGRVVGVMAKGPWAVVAGPSDSSRGREGWRVGRAKGVWGPLGPRVGAKVTLAMRRRLGSGVGSLESGRL